jgi:Mn-dependent DtxR family transcriptional regulator
MKNTFIKIPDKIMELKGKGLNAEAVLLYGKILSLSQSKGYCWATNKALSEYLKISTRSVQRALNMLWSNHLVETKTIFYKGTCRVEKRHIKPL